jgi:general secretion pathway protein D
LTASAAAVAAPEGDPELAPPPAAAKPAAGGIGVSPGSAAEKVPETQMITMDFQDVEIGVLVKFISEITGKNFILDEKVRGKVTVISPTKITIEEAYRVFQSILEVKGFTTLPAGPVTKIVPTREAKESGAPLSTKAPSGDEFITQLVPLTSTEASALVPILQPMVSKEGLVSAYEPANTLVLIDTASNIQRLLGIISELDVELPQRDIAVIRVENAYAQSIAETLQQVLQGQTERAAQSGAAARAAAKPGAAAAAPGGAAAFKIIPDERTNSVIVVASPPQMRTIRALVKELDQKLAGVSKINVVQLKYANAIEMVEVLSELIGAGGGMAGGAPSRRTTRQQKLNSYARGAGLYGVGAEGSRSLGAMSSRPLGQALGSGGGPPTGASSSAGGPVSATGSGGEFVGEVRVTADPYTNSLLVSAGPQDFDVLKRVISEIDVPRKQVYVEAIIIEIGLDKSRQMGFEYQGGQELGNEALGLGRLNLKNLNPALASPGSLSGLVLAAASNQTITLPDGTTVPAQVALFTALENDNDVNILSAPNILTSDNQEAEILVGQNIPFIASRATDSTNLANTFATVERQDVGITLRLTPQISQGDVIRLDLYEEVSAVVPNPPVDPNVAGPTTTVRSASTTIVAKNGHTVALGGLISDAVTAGQSKIPYIGDIPVIGNLFKMTDDRKAKINLLIFLTPHVVHDESDLATFSADQRDRFKRYLRQQKTGPRRGEQLDAPSWGAAAPAATPAGTAPPSSPPEAAPTPQAEPLALAPRPSASLPSPPSAEIAPGPASALGIPTVGQRFAVLLSLFEKGSAPPELQAVGGFLTVYAPVEAGEFFVKGATYEYHSSDFEGRYTCLEVFPNATTALSVYPEGRPLQGSGGAAVRWKPISAEQMRAMVAGDTPWKRAR